MFDDVHSGDVTKQIKKRGTLTTKYTVTKKILENKMKLNEGKWVSNL